MLDFNKSKLKVMSKLESMYYTISSMNFWESLLEISLSSLVIELLFLVY